MSSRKTNKKSSKSNKKTKDKIKEECGDYFLIIGSDTDTTSTWNASANQGLSIKKVEDSHSNSSFGNIVVWSMDKSIYIWTVQMYNNNIDTVVGVYADKPWSGGNAFYAKRLGFGFCADGRKVRFANFSSYGTSFGLRDVIKIKLDLNKKQISFLKNDVDQGVAFDNISTAHSIYYRLAVKMYHNKSQVTLLDFIRPQLDDINDNDDEKKQSKNELHELQRAVNELKKELNQCYQISKQQKETIINLQTVISKSDEERKEMEMKMNAMKQEIQSLKAEAIDVNQYEYWTSEEIVIWIISIENGRYKRYENDLLKSLKSSEVTGDDLNTMDVNDLQGFGITNYKDRKALIQSIQQLKQKMNANNKPIVNEGLFAPTAYISH